MAKRRQPTDLRQQHAQCETNYHRLMRLMPNMRELQAHEIAVSTSEDHQDIVRFEVLEHCPYTTSLSIVQKSTRLDWITSPSFTMRVYHDAQMAEVTSFQQQHRLQTINEYPNPRMHHMDEKAQLDRFLGEWLTHCLEHGLSNEPIVFSQAASS